MVHGPRATRHVRSRNDNDTLARSAQRPNSLDGPVYTRRSNVDPRRNSPLGGSPRHSEPSRFLLPCYVYVAAQRSPPPQRRPLTGLSPPRGRAALLLATSGSRSAHGPPCRWWRASWWWPPTTRHGCTAPASYGLPRCCARLPPHHPQPLPCRRRELNGRRTPASEHRLAPHSPLRARKGV